MDFLFLGNFSSHDNSEGSRDLFYFLLGFHEREGGLEKLLVVEGTTSIEERNSPQLNAIVIFCRVEVGCNHYHRYWFPFD